MIGLEKQKQDAGVNPGKDSSTLNGLKRDLDKEVESVMVVMTSPSRRVRTRKRKREAKRQVLRRMRFKNRT